MEKSYGLVTDRNVNCTLFHHTDVHFRKHGSIAATPTIQANAILYSSTLLLLTATASVFTSSLLSGAVRSIRTGHTLVSTSYLSMSSCSSRTNNAAWLVFLTWQKKTKIKPRSLKRFGFFIFFKCVLVFWELYIPTATHPLFVGLRERRQVFQKSFCKHFVFETKHQIQECLLIIY